MDKKTKIEVGQIYLISDNEFWSDGKRSVRLDCYRNRESKVRTRYEKGEYIEIRYPSPWHFRTQDNIYDSATDEMFEEHCILIGYVDSEVRWKNKKTLQQILDEGLLVICKDGIREDSPTVKPIEENEDNG